MCTKINKTTFFKVQNDSIGNTTLEVPERRRTMSQPGPVTGNRLTATAARAARKRPPRYVNYAADLERSVSRYMHSSPHQQPLIVQYWT